MTRFHANVIFILAICLFLFAGRSVFIPLSFALLIACILYPVCKWLEMRGFSSVAAIGMSLTLLVVGAAGLIALLVWQIAGFSSEWAQLQVKISEAWIQLSFWLNDTLHITLSEQQHWLASVQSNYGNEVLPLLKTTAGNVSIMIVLLILIPIIAALILYERKRLMGVLHALLPHVQLTELRTILNETITAYYQFIKGMLVVYLCVGILNSVGLLLLGVPHAILFGCIAAANVIFPWAVSSKLNVNTLMTIVAILAGGVMWGSSGMILFVPFLGILKLIADRMPGWEPLALLLSGSSSTTKSSTSPSVTPHDAK